jgi:alkylation response protein AidB-like acyl-CoA dehydrogenase
MHFDLSSEQRQFEDSITQLLADRADLIAMTKGAEAIDPIRRKVDSGLAELGALSVLVPEKHGGLGMDLLTLAILADRLGRAAAPSTAVQSALAGWLVAELGDGALRKRWLEGLMSGEARAAFAFNETEGEWLPEQWRASAREATTKHYVVDATHADLFVVGFADGFRFIEASAAQIAVSKQQPLDMTRPTASVAFPAGEKPVAGALAQRVYDALLALMAADAAAAGQRAFEMSVDYAKVREQFDRPIGRFQGLKHQLADMAVDIEPARFLCWYAAHAWDRELPDASRSAALAKAHAADVAVKTARAAVEAHGGIGYTWEYPLHLLLKRAMHDRVILGSPAALRKRAAALTSDTSR